MRQNQQRSRDRKRAYIADLEERVRQLSEELDRCGPSAPSRLDHVILENDARKEMLRALEIDDSAQQQFVNAFVKRKLKAKASHARSLGEVESNLQHDNVELVTSASDGGIVMARPHSTERQGQNFQASSPSDWLAAADNEWPIDLANSGFSPSSRDPRRTGLTPTTPFNLTDTVDYTNLWASLSPRLSPSLGFMSTSSLTPSPSSSCGCSLQNNTLQINAVATGDTTACSVAFSLLLQNNHRGYSTSEIDSRLQVGYRKDHSVVEGCSVVNKVLFQLLSEIS